MAFGGFSWKRALGITSAKRKIAKVTGIPTTKSGRKRKAKRIAESHGIIWWLLIGWWWAPIKWIFSLLL